jgi:hypothetical protein
MRDSEIFNEFVKIALKKGIISNAQAEHTEQNTKSPRWDSYDFSAIEALYGVKPDSPKEMEYKNNIAEVAHPNPMVISPSNDKLNGLVENVNEAQNILMHIVYKKPEVGTPNQGVYSLKPSLLYPNTLGNVEKIAHKNLLLSLVRVANDMDNKDKNELRILADTCLNQLHSLGFKKQAQWQLIVGGAVALLGATYAWQHLSDVDEGIQQNYSRLMNELEDFLTASVTLGFGHQYDDQLKQDVQQLQSELQLFWSVYTETLPLLRTLEKPKDAQDLMEMAKDPGTLTVANAYKNLVAETTKLYAYLDKEAANFADPDYKARHTVDKGAITSFIDSVPFLHGGNKTLTADDFDDVINAIGPFKDSVIRLVKIFAKTQDVMTSATSELAKSQANTKAELPQRTPASVEPNPVAGEVSDIESELKGG